MESEKTTDFQSLTKGIGVFNVENKTLLMPQMYRFGTHLMASAFRSFGINAKVLKTYRGLDLGKEYTSGKECLPCLITTGDLLYFMKREKERLVDAFNPDDYVFLMPESDGPCRFGMYNKYQRIVLDSFPEFSSVKIGSITSRDDYSLAGMVEKEKVRDLRKVAYFSLVVGDILDRLTWRVRPYEKEPGMTDDFIERSLYEISDTFEKYSSTKEFDKILDHLEDIIEEGKTIIDPTKPLKPLVGIVGEIYLRTHEYANQDIIRALERHGAEVVNTSFAEWVNYTSHNRKRDAKICFRMDLKQLHLRSMIRDLKKIFVYQCGLFYQQYRQKQIYKHKRALIDLAEDHRVSHLEGLLKEEDIFSFDVGTEACLSISGIMAYAQQGFNGVVNVYPFTCMPGTVTSTIAKPLMSRFRIPYLDSPCDVSLQPGREAAIRTFIYQVYQHFKRHGRKD